MKAKSYLLLVSLGAVAVLAAEEPSGAKALFLDPTSGAMVTASRSAPPAGTRKSPVRTMPAVIKRQPGEVTGLRYWIELEEPNGELKRVLADRPFKSGERVRLHVESNVDGNLTVLQSQNGEPFAKLFPRAGGSAPIEKFKDNMIPSAKGFFKFDQQPGDIRLIIMVQANDTVAPVAPLPPAPSRAAAPDPKTPVRAQAPSSPAAAPHAPADPVQIAAVPRPAPPVDDREAEERALRQLRKLEGSKALILDDDDAPKTAASTRLVNWAEIRGAEPGMMVIEVKLFHK